MFARTVYPALPSCWDEAMMRARVGMWTDLRLFHFFAACHDSDGLLQPELDLRLGILESVFRHLFPIFFSSRLLTCQFFV